MFVLPKSRSSRDRVDGSPDLNTIRLANLCVLFHAVVSRVDPHIGNCISSERAADVGGLHPKDCRVRMSVAAGRKLQEYSRTAEQTARDELVVSHLWLVRHIVGKLAARMPAGVDLENMESAGILGLVEASQRFDTARGVDFKAFASLRIRGAIIDEARRNCPLPQEVMRRVSLVSKALEQLPPPATTEDLSIATGLTTDEVLDALVAQPFTRVQSIEQLEFDPSEAAAGSSDAGLEREDQKKLLADAIAALPERERLVVTLYYMEDLRLKEIGHVLNLSESRVSRLLASAQHQLREYVIASES